MCIFQSSEARGSSFARSLHGKIIKTLSGGEDGQVAGHSHDKTATCLPGISALK